MVTYNYAGLYEDTAEFIQNVMHESDVDVVLMPSS